MTDIATRIRQARLGAGLSQAQVAERLGVTRSACSQWESAAGTAPRRERLQQLAELLDVSYEWLTIGQTGGLGTGKVVESAAAYEVGLKPDERELLRLFGRINRGSQLALLEFLRSLA